MPALKKSAVSPLEKKSAASAWEQRLAELLPLYGHRNWIVVADAAYPAQSRPGIETIFAGGDQVDAVTKVFNAITESTHLRANIYIDEELASVPEHAAAGVLDYRGQLERTLGPGLRRLPHEQIIARLDQAAQLVRILIVKTSMTIPYTTVFFELDCGYWTAENEQRLRNSLKSRKQKK
ncbi:MAG TPA: RbsD/FucU domain-containing protein [Bryobacteraceae bacterium]|nr:RbsD/FucU domain-containing protein [Bryobacteraceae bacterium]